MLPGIIPATSSLRGDSNAKGLKFEVVFKGNCYDPSIHFLASKFNVSTFHWEYFAKFDISLKKKIKNKNNSQNDQNSNENLNRTAKLW